MVWHSQKFIATSTPQLWEGLQNALVGISTITMLTETHALLAQTCMSRWQWSTVWKWKLRMDPKKVKNKIGMTPQYFCIKPSHAKHNADKLCHWPLLPNNYADNWNINGTNIFQHAQALNITTTHSSHRGLQVKDWGRDWSGHNSASEGSYFV